MATLYVSDLDGTLLTPQAALSAYTRTQIAAIVAAGIPFAIATSRSIDSVRAILGPLSLSLPVIEFNGAYVTDLATGQPAVINAIEPAIAEDLFSLAALTQLAPIVSSYCSGANCNSYTQVTHAGLQWLSRDVQQRKGKPWRRLSRYQEILSEPIVRLTLVDTEPRLSELEQLIHERYPGILATHLFENPYQPNWYWLTVEDRRANKGSGIREVQALRGLQDHQITVFGDHNNDIPMFQIADTALAMENATDRLKQHATEVIGHHSADSVAKYLSQAVG
ncbi:MAG: HAD family phosphatase [Leptolyngbya sp. SIO4C1]|nr:HAD family phosphatase [Leptolyngbya sp. SIO4C1]